MRSQSPRAIRVGPRNRRVSPLPVLLAVSLLLNVVLLLTRNGGDEVEPPSPEVAEIDAAADDSITPAAEPVSPEATPVVVPADGLKYVRVVIDGAVSRGFVKELGSPEGDRLALTVGRILVWDLDLRKDPRAGDVCEVIYRVDPDDPIAIEVHALRYVSGKFGRTLEAWRFQPEGWTFPGWFDSDGREVAGYLDDGPIEEYEQITSLIGDGRGHDGMDFKAPVGTPVLAPFAGTVTRTTWRFKYNGNSIEIRGRDGRLTRFLHLSAVADGVVSGSRVEAGQVVGATGNTGRSSAPHLHYELIDSSGRVLDPLDHHEVRHRRVGSDDGDRFAELRAELIARMEASAPIDG